MNYFYKIQATMKFENHFQFAENAKLMNSIVIFLKFLYFYSSKILNFATTTKLPEII